MASIIKFPGPKKVFGEPDHNPHHKLSVGPVSFTCTSCYEISHVDFKGMVFRTMEFYCMSCGNPYRVSNPAFTIATKTKK
jgi:hypothetical protein